MTNSIHDLKVRLEAAISNDDVDAIKTIYRQRIGVNTRMTDNNTPIISATMSQSLRAMSYFIDQNANIELEDIENRTALMLAASSRKTTALEILIKAGANLDRINKENQNALVFAILFENHDAVQMLLESGASPNIGKKCKQPLMYASLLGFSSCTERLIKAGADVNAVMPKNKASALHLAASKDHFHIAKMLAENGADLSIRNCDGKTATDIAITEGRHQTASFLQAYEQSASLGNCISTENSLPNILDF